MTPYDIKRMSYGIVGGLYDVFMITFHPQWKKVVILASSSNEAEGRMTTPSTLGRRRRAGGIRGI